LLVLERFPWSASTLYGPPAREVGGSVNLIGEIGTREALQGDGGVATSNACLRDEREIQ